MDGDIILPVMCPLLICSFWQESQIRNATIFCIRNIEPISSSILDSSIRKTSPFLWASASDQDSPGSIHDVFLVYGLTEGCLKSATVPESVLFTDPVPAFSSAQLLLRLKQHRAGNIRFQLRVRSRQLGSVNIGFQRGQRLFFASSKGEKLQD